MRPESFDRVIRAMAPSTNRIDAEAVLLGAFREHRDCKTAPCSCLLLDAAGAFYMAMAFHATDDHSLSKLMEAWIAVARAYDQGQDIDGPAHKIYDVAFTYRLLLN